MALTQLKTRFLAGLPVMDRDLSLRTRNSKFQTCCQETSSGHGTCTPAAIFFNCRIDHVRDSRELEQAASFLLACQ